MKPVTKLEKAFKEIDKDTTMTVNIRGYTKHFQVYEKDADKEAKRLAKFLYTVGCSCEFYDLLVKEMMKR